MVMTQAAWNPLEDPRLQAIGSNARTEWRAEQEAAISDAASVRAHSLTLRDLLSESMVRGDRLSIRCYQVRVAGTVCEIDDDLVSLRNAGAGRVDMQLRDRLPLIVQISDPAAEAGVLAPIPSGGFRGRLLACETSGEEYSVWVIGESESLDGRLEIGADTVRIHNRMGAQLLVPTSAILALTPRL